MGADEHIAGRCEVGLHEARAELERLLADQRFHATDRAKRILRYIAERCFEGEKSGVKAYAIALDVLNRPACFDTNADPIVRIEVSRLRSALSYYYEAYGPELDVTVHLPVGRYLAVFTPSVVISKPTDEEMEEAENYVELSTEDAPAMTERSRAGIRRAQVYRVGAIAMALAAAGAAAASFVVGRPEMTVRPHVTVEMSAADDGHAAEADGVARYLVSALSKFRTLDIVARRQSPKAPVAASYEIELKYYAADDDRTVWWQVVDGLDGGVLKSGVDKVQLDGRSEAVVRSELVSILARRFASSRGVIGNLEAHDDAFAGALGNACVLRGEYALDEGGRESVAAARPCLERTLVLAPNNADAMAVLSRILVVTEGADPETADFAEATTLANRAVSVDPGSDRGYVALMMAHFYAGRTDAAIASGNRALALNPDNPDVLAKLAGVLYSSGYRAAGVTLAEDASENVEAVPRDARIVLALEAYRKGDWSNASLVSEQINCSDFVVRAIRAAALGEMGSTAAVGSLAHLEEMLPDYRTSLKPWMERRRYPAEVIASLEEGLTKAERATAERTQAAN
ncbi:tetratricopeptide (TPR) repeat protein [Rhizobium sp. BK212]|uniref:hypothetical protein n=1 Tax=Rhizobium sp. BK212 TaxID=2587074 RepID=UPI00162231A1|nr:hypothetical protein [Rhizobium sp. BK212]MBB4215765.1 tetratricopeptide (TPR) repeat protein [Rhizobium sp. BK212]